MTPTSNAPAAYQDILEGKLIASVTTSTTTGVKVKVKLVNGVAPQWTTIAHRIKVIQKTATTSKAEIWAVAAGTTQSGQTVTLGTLTRALSLSDGTTFAGSGTAQSFAAGADVFLSWDLHDAAETPKLDLDNTFTGVNTFSGSIVGSGSFKVPVYADATARDAAITVPTNGMIVYLTDQGVLYQYIAGAWTTFASGTTSNASTTVAGKEENATVAEQAAHTATGGTGATLVPVVGNLVTLSSDGTWISGAIPTLNTSKYLDVSLLGSGSPSSANYLLGNNTWGTVPVLSVFGDGSDGTPTWTSGVSLDPTSDFSYVTATLPVSQTLTVSSVNSPLIIKTTGDVTINGTVDLNGKGGAAGAGGGTASSGTGGTVGHSMISGWTTGAGGGATYGANSGSAGGSGASILVNGAAGTTGAGAGGTAGTKMDIGQIAFLSNIFRAVACGAGGGGASGINTSSTGGAGGAGGGCLVWYIGGNLTLGSSSIIRANGADGNSGTTNTAGGGGGGGGCIIIIVAGSITNSGVTLSASGGAAGAGLGFDSGINGGAGAAGKALIYSLSTGTLITA